MFRMKSQSPANLTSHCIDELRGSMPLLAAVDSVKIDNLVIPTLDICRAFIKSHPGAKDAPPTDNDNSIISNLLVRF